MTPSAATLTIGARSVKGGAKATTTFAWRDSSVVCVRPTRASLRTQIAVKVL